MTLALSVFTAAVLLMAIVTAVGGGGATLTGQSPADPTRPITAGAPGAPGRANAPCLAIEPSGHGRHGYAAR